MKKLNSFDKFFLNSRDWRFGFYENAKKSNLQHCTVKKNSSTAVATNWGAFTLIWCEIPKQGCKTSLFLKKNFVDFD